MKKILFFNECLDMGGAETILKNLVVNLDKKKYDVTVVSERDGEFHTKDIRNNCHYRSFIKTDKKTKVGVLFNKLIIWLSVVLPASAVRRLFIRGKYDIEIAFCEGYSTKIIGSSLNKKSKKIAWVHTDVINYPWSEKIFGSQEKEKDCYRNFDRIVCVSGTIKDSFEKKYGLENKTEIIYNVIDFNRIIEKSKEEIQLHNSNQLNFVVVGSFKKVKGHKRLVEVFKELKSQNYKFTVTLMGSGSEYKVIENLIEEYGLTENFTMMEYNDNPYKYVSKSDALICSSYAEGYSTTVTEAVILGVPVITTECSGMREIFGDKECGIICENSTEGLYNAIKSVLDNPDVLKKYASNAVERAKDFDTKKRIAEIEQFLDSI